MDIQFPAVFEPQEPSGFFVRFVDIPEAITQGEDRIECEYNGAEVLSLILEEYFETEREIPRPSANVKNAHYIAPDAEIQAALLNRWAKNNLPSNGHVVIAPPPTTKECFTKAGQAMATG
ncbi:MAG: type II toxin-antitoxin system HicB family antitoxin [Gammaproteobacteria bacterium]|nr:type II toxin-antitoxin system HicB family antitoxin [Gammaproteobacteria bacterium]NNJ85081.1 type II toxin-antitoxin system HicB family antitoxin [Gammaproteobacteria bacterium]